MQLNIPLSGGARGGLKLIIISTPDKRFPQNIQFHPHHCFYHNNDIILTLLKEG